MAGEILIRQAMLLDAEAVSGVLNEAALWLEQSGAAMWKLAELETARIVEDVEAGRFFLAENAGDVAGTVRFQLDDPLFWPEAREGEAAYVHRLAVRRRYARMGVSVALLRWAVGRTRDLGRPYLRLDCAASRAKLRAMYEGFGFRHHSYDQIGPYCVARYEYDVTMMK